MFLKRGFLLLLFCCVLVTEGGKLPVGYRSVVSPRTSPAPTTTPARGCEYRGKIYPPGSRFGDGYDPHSNWCYGAFCSENSELLYWDNFNCRRTTTPPTTPPEGCSFNGKLYPPGTDIDSGYDESNDWCYGVYCDDRARVISWNQVNCKSSTTSPATTSTSTTSAKPSRSFSGISWPLLKKLKKVLKQSTSFGEKA